MNTLSKSIKIFNVVVTYAVYIGSLAVFIMMVVGTVDVLLVKLAGTALPGAFELTEASMVVMVFTSLAYVQRRRGHIRVTMLVSRLPGKLRSLADLAALILSFCLFVMVTWRGGILFWTSWQVREVYSGLLLFPVYPWKFTIILGTGLISIQLLIDIIQNVMGFSTSRSKVMSR